MDLFESDKLFRSSVDKIKKESEFEKNLEIKVELEDLDDHRDEAIKKIGKQI